KIIKNNIINVIPWFGDNSFSTYLANQVDHNYVINWKKYNESLVRKREVLFDFDVIDNRDIELIRRDR
ncbi:MAG: hypothetical protein ACXWEW_11365, partial [Nitrososphaeraceae archaeon]